MERNQPIQTDYLVLPEWALQKERYFCLDVCGLKVNTNGLECLSHFYSHIGKISHLLLAISFRLIETCLRVDDFYLLP